MSLFNNWNNTNYKQPLPLNKAVSNNLQRPDAELGRDTSLSFLKNYNGFIIRTTDLEFLPSFCGAAFLEAALQNRIADFDFIRSKTKCSVFVVSYYFCPWLPPPINLYVNFVSEFFETWSKKFFLKDLEAFDEPNSMDQKNEVSKTLSYSYFYKKLETLIVVFYENAENDLVFQNKIANANKMLSVSVQTFSLAIFYPKYIFKLMQAFGRFKKEYILGLKPSPAIQAQRFDRFSPSRPRKDGFLNTKDVKNIWLIPDKIDKTLELEYVYYLLDYIMDLRDQKDRPLFWFDTNCFSYFSTDSALNNIALPTSKVKWLDLLKDKIISQNNLVFTQYGEIGGFSVRFADYHKNNSRTGRVLATIYTLKEYENFYKI